MVRFISSAHTLVVFVCPLLLCLRCNHNELGLAQNVAQSNDSLNGSYQTPKTSKEEVPPDSEERKEPTKTTAFCIRKMQENLLACKTMQEEISKANIVLKEKSMAIQSRPKIPEYVYVGNVDKEESGFFSIFNIFGIRNSSNTTDTLSTVDTSFGNFSNDDDSLLSITSGREEDPMEISQELNDQQNSTAQQHRNDWWRMSWLYRWK